MNVQKLREQFPALSSSFIFMDNAGGSQVLGRVADEVRDYLITDNVQHGASYEVSARSVARLTESLECFKIFLNAKESSELLFGASATQLTKNMATAMDHLFSEGDEIILTNTEHEANAGPWKALAARVGAHIKYWRVNTETWQLDMDELMDLVTPKTKLIAMCHASNIVGVINPVKAVCQFARQNKILTFIDGVAWGAHGATDVQALDCDFYVLSLYKIFGPHIGLLYARKTLLEQLPNANHGHIPLSASPYRFQPGGVCYELAVGAQYLVRYLNSPDHSNEALQWSDIAATFKAFNQHEEALTAKLLSFLINHPQVRIIGPSNVEKRVGTVSFVVEGKTPESICRSVDKHGIGIRHGHFHCVQLLKDLALFERGGVVRVSLAHYNTEEEVQKLLMALEGAL